MKARINIPFKYEQIKKGYGIVEGDYCLQSSSDGIKSILEWQKWKGEGILHMVKKDEIFIRKICSRITIYTHEIM